MFFRAGVGAMNFQKTANELGNLITILPCLRYICPLLSNYRALRKSSMELVNFMKEILEEHLHKHENGEILNFLDTYIEEMKSIGADERGFDNDQFLMICTDFIFPSLSALPSQISFLFRTLLLRQDIVMKIQGEIDEVVGQSRLLTLNDRAHMPYTEATLRENMRYDTLAHAAVGHKALVDTKL